MKHSVVAILATVAFFAGTLAAQAQPLNTRSGTTMIVRVSDSVARPQSFLANLLRITTHHAVSINRLEPAGQFDDSSYAKRLFRVTIPGNGESVLRTFRTQKGVEYAERDASVKAAWTPNDPNFSDQWHLSTIHAEEAWDADTTPPLHGGDPSVIVAVLDTGIAFEQYTDGSGTFAQAPDLAGTLFAAGYDFVNNDAHPNDDNGHGTHVASTIAEQTDNNLDGAGLAFNTTLMPIKILNSSGVGAISDVVTGIDYAIQHGANVINLSLGSSTPSKALQDSVARAIAANVIVVAAVGNESSSSISYPAAYSGVIAVSAVGKDLSLASYSNSGTGVSIAAPGGDGNDFIWQETFSNLDTNHLPKDYTTFGLVGYQGTSQASPQVSGAAALLLSQGVPAAQIPTLLENTTTDLGPPGYDTKFGYGLLNVSAAISAVTADTTPPTSTITIAPSAPEGLGGYYKTRPTVTLSATDGASGSGVRTLYYHLDNDADMAYSNPFTVPDGSHTLNVHAVDATGNAEQLQTRNFLIDTTPPEVTFQSSALSVTNRHITIQGVIADAVSGFKSLTLNGTNIPINSDGSFTTSINIHGGKNILAFLATDNAGTSAKIPYTIRLVLNATAIIAPGKGNGPNVLMFDKTGKRVGQFFAYDKSFRGGVNLAAADINGDGNDEIIAAPASSGGPQVRIFSSDGKLQGQFFAYDKSYHGGVRLASIDYNNDGKDEIVTAPTASSTLPIRWFTQQGKLIRQMTDLSSKGNGNAVLGVGDIFGDGTQRMIALGQNTGSSFLVYNTNGKLEKKIAVPKNWLQQSRSLSVGDLRALGKTQFVLGRGATSTLPLTVLDDRGTILLKFQPVSAQLEGGWSTAIRYNS